MDRKGLEDGHLYLKIGLFRAVVVAFFCLLTMVGCDGRSSKGVIEDVRMAMDGKDYKRALALLVGEKESPEVLRLRGDAYAGLAGVDLFVFLSQMNGADDSRLGRIDTLALGGSFGLLCAEFGEKMAQISQAKVLVLRCANTINNKARLGVYGFSDVVLILGFLLCENHASELSPLKRIVLTEEAIGELRGQVGGTFDGMHLSEETLERLTDDLAHMKGAVQALEAENDISEELRRFVERFDIDGDGYVSSFEVVNILDRMD